MSLPPASPVFGGLEGLSGETTPAQAGTPPPAAAAPDQGPRWYRLLFAVPPTPGVWLGFIGLALIIIASALPWYTVSARFPTAGYAQFTPIVQFDGLNGLFVHPELKANLGLSPPAVGFPVAIFFVVSCIMKARKILRSATHKMRAGTLVRGSLLILLPWVATVAIVSQATLFTPADAPDPVKGLVQTIAGQPLGGASVVTLDAPANGTYPGELRWGFGPAIWLMITSVVLLNVSSRLELQTARRAHREMLVEQAGHKV